MHVTMSADTRRLPRTAVLLIATALVAACGSGGTPQPLNGRFLISSGGAALAQLDALTKRFTELNPGVHFDIENVGSDAGVSLVANGHSELGGISRDVTAQEKGTVALEPLGIVGTAVAVELDNPVVGLTVAQVRSMFSGEITMWSQVGGTDLAVKVFLRDPTAATRQSFDEFVFAGRIPTYAKGAVVVGNNTEMGLSIRSFRGSIGMVTLKQATLDDKRIRLIAIDGVPATLATLNDGTYKIRRPLYLVYPVDRNKLKAATSAFLDFVRSTEGQKILATF